MVGMNIMRYIQTELHIRDPTMVHIHIAYEKLRELMHRLSAAYNLTAEATAETGVADRIKRQVEKSEEVRYHDLSHKNKCNMICTNGEEIILSVFINEQCSGCRPELPCMLHGCLRVCFAHFYL